MKRNHLKPIQLYEKIVKQTRIKKWVYGVFYYLLNSVSIFTALYISYIALQFLAGNNKNFPGGANAYPGNNPYFSPFFNDSTNYILLTTIINSAVSLISGVISFFVINTRFLFYKRKYNILVFEKTIYMSKLYIYNGTHEQNQFMLYKRVLQILETDRYKSSVLLNVNVDLNKGENNEKK
ncbi:DUF4231 domain-containing protein [Mycoplasmopsis felis]|uniref:DUF4231 domain-containing protein n=1 Tax=Mycoplasmopsis felis TaxID=33923 RepID=UPI002AFDEE4D|nr:DUF4231 domain-containing protein [Mycoplasmopsis felis]WQQ11010.1 DUF4231 domain-containing protein [Mycoplasmopsis felis]